MAEVNDQTEVKTAPNIPDLSRRRFLQVSAAAALVGSLALHKLANRANPLRPPEDDNKTDNGSKIEAPDLQTRLKDFALQNYDEADRKAVEPIIDYWRKLYKGSSAFKEDIERLEKNYVNFIHVAYGEVSKRVGAIDDRFIALMAGLILAESSARDNPPEGEDIGVCQLTPDAINDAKKILGPDYKDADPKDPKINIILSLAYLAYINKSYPAVDLTIWNYNLGMANMAYGIEEYGVEKLGEDQRDNLNQTLSDTERGPAHLIRSLKINAIRLLQSPKARQVLEVRAPHVFRDKAEEYFFKVLGASLAVIEVKEESISQTPI